MYIVLAVLTYIYTTYSKGVGFQSKLNHLKDKRKDVPSIYTLKFATPKIKVENEFGLSFISDK